VRAAAVAKTIIVLRNIAHAPSDATGVHSLKIRPSAPTARVTPTKS
jgi:hypothetical protein